jgi:hypothetical protein
MRRHLGALYSAYRTDKRALRANLAARKAASLEQFSDLSLADLVGLRPILFPCRGILTRPALSATLIKDSLAPLTPQ